MKRLLHACGSYLIVGISDRAYVVDRAGNTVSELKRHAPVASEKQKETPGKPSSEQSTSGLDLQPTEPSKGSSTEGTEDLHVIQAVAVNFDEDDSTVWCAVARGNKSLAIYKIESKSTVNEHDYSKHCRPIDPCTVHMTSKRVCSLCFGSLPRAPTVNADEVRPITAIIVAGDLAGDAYGYSLRENQRRLLLGHTGSVLTRVCVSRGRILTADRDEKIRVSLFPETHVIDGFLLGHTAYVTGMDIAAEGATKQFVATCSGDGSLRLWSLEAFQQLAHVSLNTSPKSSTDATPRIPTDIAIDPKGNKIAIIYDESKQVDLYQVLVDDDKTMNVSLERTLECPCQALSVIFHENEALMILMRDPDYLMVHNMMSNSTALLETPEVIETVRQLASAENLVMPDTILEKDKYGKPKFRKLEDNRGPSSNDAPWNRVERIEIAKERDRRAKKRRWEKKQ